MKAEIVGGAGPGREIVAPGLRLREGATVVARVLQAAGQDGFGLLSLAGARVRAQLPAQLQAGQRLGLLVAGMVDDKVVLRLLDTNTDNLARRVPASQLADRALRGDGQLLRAAAELADGLVPLPGDLLLQVDPDDAGEEQAEDGEEQAAALRLVLHSPVLGALELRVALIAGRIGVAVTADPGRAFALAAEEQAALTERLEAVTGLAAAVGVQARRGDPPRRPEPPELGEVRVYA
jgi:hypothetical protein